MAGISAGRADTNMSVRLSTYNNEALATICIGYYAKLSTEISHPKAMIILPFVFHEQTAKRLRGISNKRSLDEFILGNTDCLINFNKRFIDFLPVAVNAITMLNEMGIVTFTKNNVRFNNETSLFNPHISINLGRRATALLSSIEALVPMLYYEEDWSAYLKLKIIV